MILLTPKRRFDLAACEATEKFDILPGVLLGSNFSVMYHIILRHPPLR